MSTAVVSLRSLLRAYGRTHSRTCTRVSEGQKSCNARRWQRGGDDVCLKATVPRAPRSILLERTNDRSGARGRSQSWYRNARYPGLLVKTIKRSRQHSRKAPTLLHPLSTVSTLRPSCRIDRIFSARHRSCRSPFAKKIVEGKESSREPPFRASTRWDFTMQPIAGYNGELRNSWFVKTDGILGLHASQLLYNPIRVLGF